MTAIADGLQALEGGGDDDNQEENLDGDDQEEVLDDDANQFPIIFHVFYVVKINICVILFLEFI